MRGILVSLIGWVLLIGFALKAVLDPEPSSPELMLTQRGHYGEAVAAMALILAALLCYLAFIGVKFVRTTARLHVLERRWQMQEAVRLGKKSVPSAGSHLPRPGGCDLQNPIGRRS